MDNARLTDIDPKSWQEPPIFTATLQPYRSLSPRGLRLVLGLVGFAGLVVSIPFLLLGAWPVAGFMGLDVLLIYLAFRANNASARAYEQIIVSRIELLVRQVSWRGASREARLNPRWTRLEREEDPDFGPEALTLVQGRARVEIARCLGRAERAEFATAFQHALAEAKR